MGYICRKDDVGGTTPDSGSSPPDAGAPPPTDGGTDNIAPQVTISSPTPNAQVSASTKVVAQATDDRGVTRVELLVDSTLVASQNALPYEFSIVLQAGTHTLTAVAYDAANNKGQAAVSVTVQGTGPTPDGGGVAPSPDQGGGVAPPPDGAFGSSCLGAGDCNSGLCVNDQALGSSYCSEPCNAAGGCPENGVCLESSGGSQLCGLQLSQPDPRATGCSMVTAPRSLDIAGFLAMGLLLLGLSLRRSRD